MINAADTAPPQQLAKHAPGTGSAGAFQHRERPSARLPKRLVLTA
jgi:hypothetical protein